MEVGSGPADRAQSGNTLRAGLLGNAPPATTPLEASWRDFVFAEIWARPGLDLRSRFWTAIAGAAHAMGDPTMLDAYLRGALTHSLVTQAELAEAALHLAVYAGWSRGDHLEAAVKRVSIGLGMDPPPVPLSAPNDDPVQRRGPGIAGFEAIMSFPFNAPSVPLFDAGNLNFVFPEMWLRGGLDIRSRRWISLVCAAEASLDAAVASHFYAALKRGDASSEELDKFVLQYAVHGGWPRASMLQARLLAEMAKIAEGRPFQ